MGIVNKKSPPTAARRAIAGRVALAAVIPFGLIALAFGAAPALASIVSDYLSPDQYTASGPSAYNGQERGYISAGSFSTRTRSRTDQLIAITPPYIKAGCGGIDIFAGSMSYLNYDKIVAKMQNILKAAPAAAFDLALNTLCTPCANTMKAMNQMADAFNTLQVNDCAAAKAGVAKIAGSLMPTDSEAQKKMFDQASEFGIGNGFLESWNKGLDTLKSENDPSKQWGNVLKQFGAKNPGDTNATDPLIGGCPVALQSYLAAPGRWASILQNVAADNGITAYAPLMSGLFGDVLVTGSETGFAPRPLDPCTGSIKVDQVIEGYVQLRDMSTTSGRCLDPSDETYNLLDYFRGRVQGVADAMVNRSAPTADGYALLATVPFNIAAPLKYAVQTNQVPNYVELLSRYAAASFAYTAISDLRNGVMKAIYAFNSAYDSAPTTGTCNKGMLDPIRKALVAWKDQINAVQTVQLEMSYQAVAEDIIKRIDLADTMMTLQNRIEAQTVKSFNRAVAQRIRESR